MNISKLIEELEKIKKEHGDIVVITQTLSHSWPPEPIVKGNKTKFILLNP
jgi:hypothetical protein